MADGSPARWIMRKAMEELYTAASLENVRSFIQLEASDRTNNTSGGTAARVIWSEMVAMALAGRVEITGHRNGGPEEIIPLGRLPKAQPDFNANTLQTDDMRFSGVLVREMNLEASPELHVAPRKGKGGAPSKHDWTPFAREVVRIGWQEGFTTRRELTVRMREWCAKNMPEIPDESTVRRRVNELCPDDIPA